MEHKIAKRLADQIFFVGFEVSENIGRTGIFAILKNGQGPMLMVHADMDGLPILEMSGLKNASKAKMKDWNGEEVVYECLWS
jgi:hippurate hydrolase